MLKLLLTAIVAFLSISGAIAAEPAATGSSSSLTEWFTRTKVVQAQYRESIPAQIRDELKKAYPNFAPLLFFAKSPEIVRGDFNCDAKEDYAMVGLVRTNELATAFQQSNPSSQTLQRIKKEFDAYTYDKPAVVIVALSSKRGLLWVVESGSYVGNVGSSCGCCEIAESDQQWIKRRKCEFLSIACCEKDGSYSIYEQDSTQVRFGGGC